MSFRQIPDENRVFTTEEIEEILGTTRRTIAKIAELCNIEYRVPLGKMKIWTYIEFKTISDYFKTHSKKCNDSKEKRESNLAELQKEHPLVTNPKWFRLSAFPDVIPKGFEDIPSIIFQ